jgi:hypothetical protein
LTRGSEERYTRAVTNPIQTSGVFQVVAFVIFDSELAIELAHPINVRTPNKIREQPKCKRKKNVRRMTQARACILLGKRETNRVRGVKVEMSNRQKRVTVQLLITLL